MKQGELSIGEPNQTTEGGPWAVAVACTCGWNKRVQGVRPQDCTAMANRKARQHFNNSGHSLADGSFTWAGDGVAFISVPAAARSAQDAINTLFVIGVGLQALGGIALAIVFGSGGPRSSIVPELLTWVVIWAGAVCIAISVIAWGVSLGTRRALEASHSV